MFSNGAGLRLAKRVPQPTTGRVDIPLAPDEKAAPMSFSKKLRAETAQAHRITESTSFVKSILRGAVDKESYRNMQTGLYIIYSAMEQEPRPLNRISTRFGANPGKGNWHSRRPASDTWSASAGLEKTIPRFWSLIVTRVTWATSQVDKSSSEWFVDR